MCQVIHKSHINSKHIFLTCIVMAIYPLLACQSFSLVFLFCFFSWICCDFVEFLHASVAVLLAANISNIPKFKLATHFCLYRKQIDFDTNEIAFFSINKSHLLRIHRILFGLVSKKSPWNLTLIHISQLIISNRSDQGNMIFLFLELACKQL